MYDFLWSWQLDVNLSCCRKASCCSRILRTTRWLWWRAPWRRRPPSFAQCDRNLRTTPCRSMGDGSSSTGSIRCASLKWVTSGMPSLINRHSLPSLFKWVWHCSEYFRRETPWPSCERGRVIRRFILKNCQLLLDFWTLFGPVYLCVWGWICFPKTLLSISFPSMIFSLSSIHTNLLHRSPRPPPPLLFPPPQQWHHPITMLYGFACVFYADVWYFYYAKSCHSPPTHTLF